ncbi:EKC/KEOPS complex subunit PCC1/LAGE3 [Entomortierella parvispora]|uniref:EKC/KEOPS complex subunit PCC1/LAGE3 n=1 Tax=Entomortierella parvispora TaxID=205924 RepID=A0A9P3HBJ3_9FUNG|nr:EKC/KEOPS complex subunit PCC1/LAGE3 [Entomortierella parvispora]
MALTALNEHLALRIPFPSPRLAKIAADVLDVDKDLKPEVSRRTISTEENILLLDFQTSTLKLLRTMVNSSLEMVQLVVNTMGAFDTEDQEETATTTVVV